jgi:hypothetical protein
MKGLTRRLVGACVKVHALGVGAGRGAGRRGFVTQAQRRKATTASGGKGLGFPVVDHHYE